MDFGRPVRPEEGNTVQMRIEMKETATRSGISQELLNPDWAAQRFRMAVPCEGTHRYHWRRVVLVTTLGQILRALGDKFSASLLYYVYCSRRIVAVKATPGASSPIAATKLHTAYDRTCGSYDWKQRLVEQFCKEAGLDNCHDKHVDLFQKALLYLQAQILQDLSPPWMESAQPLAGRSLLSRYTRASYIQWPRALLLRLFGKSLVEKVSDMCKDLDFELCGLVARPMLMCTARVANGRLCTGLAAMSSLLPHTTDRHWLCSECVNKSTKPCVPRRLLHLFPLVPAGDDSSTPMRAKPLLVTLDPPPHHWQWQRGSTHDSTPGQHPTLGEAAPTFDREGNVFEFGGSQSDSIWLLSFPYNAPLHAG